MDELVDGVIEELLSEKAPISSTKSIQCIFQSIQEEDSLEWYWKPPKKIESIKEIDIVLILHTIDPMLIISQEVRDRITYLSQTINQLRNTLKLPLKCDINTVYHYLLLMKRIVHLFQSTNITYRCFFTGELRSRHVIIEYINILLLTSATIYYKASLLPDGDVKIDLYQQCHVIMKEARDCVEHIMNEHYIASSYIKWSYKRSPRAISNTSSPLIPQSITDVDESDIEMIRQFVTQELGGYNHLDATVILMKIKSIEPRIRLIIKEITLDLVENNRHCHESLAPLIETVKEYYNYIKEKTNDNVLQNYANDMMLYWKTIQQLILVRSDFECYKVNDDPDIGKRALKRMELLGDLTSTEKENAQLLYNEITNEINHANEIDSLEIIKPYILPEDKKTFKFYATTKWQSFEKHTIFNSILAHLKDLHDNPPSHEISLPQNIIESPIELDNITKEVFIRDRIHLLNWLLNKEDDGIITLDNNAVNILKENYNELERVVRDNTLFIQ